MLTRRLVFVLLALTWIGLQSTPLWAGEGPQIALVSYGRKTAGVYLIGADGSALRKLHDAPAMGLAVSPDGAKIGLLSMLPADQELLFRYQLSFHSLLYVLDIQSKKLTRVSPTPMSMFAWSPDGRQILFSSSYESKASRGKDGSVANAIYRMGADGTGQQRLTPVRGLAGNPRWSPDGKRFAYEASGKVWVALADGSAPRALGTGSNPLWSSDGTRIACVHRPGGMEQNAVTVLFAVDGGKRTQLTRGMPMAWTPDSKALVVQTYAPRGCAVVPVDGGASRSLALGEGRLRTVTASADGKRLFYSIRQGKLNRLYRIGLDGQGHAPVTPDGFSIISYALVPAPQRK